jgi:hypothetical protein
MRFLIQQNRPRFKLGQTGGGGESALGGGFGAEDALEARAGELHADQTLAVGLLIGDMHDAALGLEVGFAAARSIARKRNANLQIGAEGDIEARQERRSAAAQIFAGCFFLEGDAAAVAAANFERQADGDSTFQPLSRRMRAGRRRLLGRTV